MAWTRYTRRISLAAIFAASLLLFLLVGLFRSQLYFRLAAPAYLLIHNVVEFFSVMVSLSIFSVGWFSFDQSRDRHALFLSTAFLAIGIVDFMHALSFPGMPDFVTPNSTNKAILFWVSARTVSALAFLVSAFTYPGAASRWLKRYVLLPVALLIPGLTFAAVIFAEARLPAMFVEGSGLTPLKVYIEYLIAGLFVCSFIVYWVRFADTANRALVRYQSAIILCIFSELAFTLYQSAYDTYNLLGHVYKLGAFCLIYWGIFTVSIKLPYLELSSTGERLRRSEERYRRLSQELEQRVAERTSELDAANKELEAFAYSVSHDLRAPLRHINGFLTILQEQIGSVVDVENRHYMTAISDSANRMGVLIDDLLSFSRMARHEMIKGEIDIGDLAR